LSKQTSFLVYCEQTATICAQTAYTRRFVVSVLYFCGVLLLVWPLVRPSFAFLVPPSRCAQLLVQVAFGFFGKKLQMVRRDFFSRGPRDVVGWSMVGG
jgi:hypothetical protein